LNEFTGNIHSKTRHTVKLDTTKGPHKTAAPKLGHMEQREQTLIGRLGLDIRGYNNKTH
jgi:hypothetical protein